MNLLMLVPHINIDRLTAYGAYAVTRGYGIRFFMYGHWIFSLISFYHKELSQSIVIRH
jgi:hypothetical protein